MEFKQYYIYIMSNQRNSVLYVGMTGKVLPQRIWEHRQKLVPGFTKRYNVDKLVYYEVGDSAAGAIAREKQLKAGSRKRKVDLILSMNPDWKDLYMDLV